MFDITIIGCGIIGAAVAYEFSKYELSVVVLEKENDVSMGATKANSAIIHAGFDPRPGSLMARLNVQGNMLARELFDVLDIPHKKCGALVLAFSQEEMQTLEKLLETGEANGVPGLSILSKNDVLKLEPNISDNIAGALSAPTTMIVSPWEYALALAEVAVVNGVKLYTETEVTNIQPVTNGYNIQTTKGEFATRYIINAAGLFSDDINNMINETKIEILPDIGEYFLLDKNEGTQVNQVIFQCPTPQGKGVLVAPTVHGNLIVGPSSVAVQSRNDTSNTQKGLDSVKTLAQKSVPGIDFRANIRNFSGIRAKSTVKDFIITKPNTGFVNLAGIASPGLSAAPAIAKMAVDMVSLDLKPKTNFIGTRKRVRFHDLSPQEISQNSAYGNIVCRCETVTEGEVYDALNSPIPPASVDGVKRRTTAGLGRCQGGFCAPRIVEILANWYKCCPTKILQEGVGTEILTSEMK